MNLIPYNPGASSLPGGFKAPAFERVERFSATPFGHGSTPFWVPILVGIGEFTTNFRTPILAGR